MLILFLFFSLPICRNPNFYYRAHYIDIIINNIAPEGYPVIHGDRYRSFSPKKFSIEVI